MGTFDIGHPDVLEFIRSKRESGRLRQFNLSLLVSDAFMKAVKSEGEWQLAFPLGRQEYEACEAGERPNLDDSSKYVWRDWPYTEGYVTNEDGLWPARSTRRCPRAVCGT
jgi:ribonucleoside-diphosphate reductase alpha chain